MKQILTGWNLMRWLRLIIGVYALVQSAIEYEPLLAVAGVFLTTMAVFNVGCCGVGGCATTFKPVKKEPGQNENIQFEEIK
ncbi:hypothetical protein [Flavihumibacter fluvii]|uniref:hypothetical protein n=1 Tax=Flavihumibacter fluvii TaxID=2838157 RepID=UPI001BDEBD2D|nr:hypothetical protein [Flavihumibacter fluvii]ULQ51540.1 hypothetical protein KJS93_15735 [Flavihumibacter fluvii]